MLPLPRCFEPERAGQLYLERADEVAREALAYAKAHGIRPAREDRVRICAFGIDLQVAFALPGASLFVPGAVEDTERTLRWLYGNLDRITSLVFSLDTHTVFQIFHPAWWEDADGNHPPPFTPITRSEVAGGRWRPRFHPEASREYVEKLERGGRYVLTIWPYHALLGGVSHALVPAIREAVVFHVVARQVPPALEVKGQEPLTESYSVLSPEVTELQARKLGGFNAQLFERLMDHDAVYVFGQAKSHCVLSTLFDLRDRIAATDRALARKVHILVDAMSPVPPPPLDPLPPGLDFPRVAEAGLRELEQFGMRLVRTTDPVGG